MSITPDNADRDQCFTIAHPFHPRSSHTIPLLAQHFAWGEERVFFVDPQMQQTRSLPLTWTSLTFPDPFLAVADGRTVLRLSDAQHLAQLLRQKQTPHQEDHSYDLIGSRYDRELCFSPAFPFISTV